MNKCYIILEIIYIIHAYSIVLKHSPIIYSCLNCTEYGRGPGSVLRHLLKNSKKIMLGVLFKTKGEFMIVLSSSVLLINNLFLSLFASLIISRMPVHLKKQILFWKKRILHLEYFNLKIQVVISNCKAI